MCFSNNLLTTGRRDIGLYLKIRDHPPSYSTLSYAFLYWFNIPFLIKQLFRVRILGQCSYIAYTTISTLLYLYGSAMCLSHVSSNSLIARLRRTRKDPLSSIQYYGFQRTCLTLITFPHLTSVHYTSCNYRQ